LREHRFSWRGAVGIDIVACPRDMRSPPSDGGFQLTAIALVLSISDA